MEFSVTGSRWTERSGIEELMEDLGHALAEGGSTMKMLGGGNPAIIPGVAECWRRGMQELLAEPNRFDRMLAVYDPPKGNSRFALALAGYLQRAYGWNVGAENIAITAGGQTAFFYLFNLLAGEHANGTSKRIVFPIMPEYIGYANQGLDPDMFMGIAPDITFTGKHDFKYRVDFSRLKLDETSAAVCVSRPTNPSGNVLTNDEMRHLDALCRDAAVPLIVDNAYGAPFPGILFRSVTPHWNENTILILSLSKLGLPGTRTGIVIARPEIVHAIAAMNAVAGLANGTIGQALLTPLLESGEVDRLAHDHIRPFYVSKAKQARAWVDELFDPTLDYFVHETEGAMFLWVWFRDLPITARELYIRLKHRGVLIVPGDYFGFGCEDVMNHVSKCIRLNFAMDDSTVREGIQIIAEELRRIHAGA
jgi:valine--pyruvate aminotransferase